MANKITQLVNESGDNLYPLAGGMAADSIGTEMLKDNSVTSDKIDYTTIGDLSKYDITVENHNSGSVTFTSGAWKETYRSTGGQYPTGTILLMHAYATFTGNSTGDRGVVIRTTTADAASTVVRAPSASGVAARVAASWEVTIGSDTTTFGVAGYQSSGGDLAGVVYLRIVVLAPKS